MQEIVQLVFFEVLMDADVETVIAYIFRIREIAQFVADGDSGKFLPNDDAVKLMSSRAGSA